MKEGTDRIIRRIMDDAQAKAESIKVEALDKAKAVESDARQKAARKQDQILEQARKMADEQKSRIVGVAQLETRKSLLAGKQEVIGVVFQKALNELINLDDKTYLSIIRALLLDIVETGSENVICSVRDKKRIPDEFWKEVNEALVSRGKKGELKPSKETRDIQGGFILQAEGIEMNCSFESLLEMKRDELEPEVAELLFK